MVNLYVSHSGLYMFLNTLDDYKASVHAHPLLGINSLGPSDVIWSKDLGQHWLR